MVVGVCSLGPQISDAMNQLQRVRPRHSKCSVLYASSEDDRFRVAGPGGPRSLCGPAPALANLSLARNHSTGNSVSKERRQRDLLALGVESRAQPLKRISPGGSPLRRIQPALAPRHFLVVKMLSINYRRSAPLTLLPA